MLRHFLEYEKIEQESKIEGMNTITGEDPDNTTEQDTLVTFCTNFGWMLLFYVCYLLLFFIGGSMLFKLCIMLKSGALPSNLWYRSRRYNDLHHPNKYNVFFSNGVEKQINNFFSTEFFKVKYEPNDIYFPIYMSYSRFYDNTLVRIDIFNRVFTLENDKSIVLNEHYSLNASNGDWKFFLNPNGFYMAVVSMAYCKLNYVLKFFSRVPFWLFILVALGYSLSSIIPFITDVSNNNVGTNTFRILWCVLMCTFIPSILLISVFTSIPIWFYYTGASLSWRENMDNGTRWNDWSFFNNWRRYTFPTSEVPFVYVLWAFRIVFSFAILGFNVIGWVVSILFATYKTVKNTFDSAGCFQINDKWHEFTWTNTIIYILPIYCFSNTLITLIVIFLPIIVIAYTLNIVYGNYVLICTSLFILFDFLYLKNLKKIKQSYLDLIYKSFTGRESVANAFPESNTNLANDAPSRQNPCDELGKRINNGLQPGINVGLNRSETTRAQEILQRQNAAYNLLNPPQPGTPSNPTALLALGQP